MNVLSNIFFRIFQLNGLIKQVIFGVINEILLSHVPHTNKPRDSKSGALASSYLSRLYFKLFGLDFHRWNN